MSEPDGLAISPLTEPTIIENPNGDGWLEVYEGGITREIGYNPEEPEPERPEVPDEIPEGEPMPPAELHHSLPVVPGGADGPNQGVVTVSTDALRVFSANLKELLVPLADARTALDPLAVRAGAFYGAFHLEHEIHGDTGLQKNTSEALRQSIEAIEQVRSACARLAAEYDSAEELNAASAENLQEYVATADTIINGMASE